MSRITDTLKTIKRTLTNYRELRFLYDQAINDQKAAKVNLGQLQSQANREKKNISSLSEVEFQVFSQFGDDGIIQWLVQQLPVPNKTFIEFGTENYREANTRFLLINNYWSGLIIDGNAMHVRSIKKESINWFYDLQAECSFITKDNINELLSAAKFNKEAGLLSIDIDGNDYWIWKAIHCIEPIIVIAEYNGLFGFEHPYSIAYKDDFVRGTTYPLNFYGMSLRSAYDLAKEKGYGFIGCNSAGNNAYFIREDHLKYLPIPVLTPEQGYVFAGFTESFGKNGERLRGADKVRSINELPVVNTATGNAEKVDAAAIVQSLISSGKLTRF